MKQSFRKTILVALIAALGLATLPLASVFAAGESDPPTPQRQISADRLERIWARQLRIYARMGHAVEFIEKIQDRIDRAQANGKDVSAMQATLDAFASALKDARPVYESITDLVDSHPGFDENGNVTDSEEAQETIETMRGKFRAIKDVMDGTRRALHEAIKAFREANPRPEPTPTTTNG